MSLVPAMLLMSFWWFTPIQKKLTAFSSILWCLSYFNTQTFYVAITRWYRHYQLDSTRGDLRDLKDNKGMKNMCILWTLADEQAHFPDSLNVYIQVFLTVFYFFVGVVFLSDFQKLDAIISGVRNSIS